MGADAVGLIVDWEPVVAACASAGSMGFGWRDPDGGDLRLRPWRVRKLVDAAFAGTACAFSWDEQGALWVRPRGAHVLRCDERGEVRAEPRKSGKPVDLKLGGIPGVDRRRMPGPGMPLVEAGWYYRQFRESLPDAIRQPADALVALLYPESLGAPTRHDDLSVDASVPLAAPVVYGLRPATVLRAVRHGADISWAALRDAMEKTAEEFDAFERFETAMTWQTRWLTEAGDRGRGVIALIML
ncbi:hypothetical protein [Nonomuraea helvata]|uniref:DUF1877 family protein n=1 Tax=Nonomuraea helvata TaxID=37484 RepID=A0ABV5S190_9ACTN